MGKLRIGYIVLDGKHGTEKNFGELDMRMRTTLKLILNKQAVDWILTNSK